LRDEPHNIFGVQHVLAKELDQEVCLLNERCWCICNEILLAPPIP
jgi:hypothetical protein